MRAKQVPGVSLYVDFELDNEETSPPLLDVIQQTISEHENHKFPLKKSWRWYFDKVEGKYMSTFPSPSSPTSASVDEDLSTPFIPEDHQNTWLQKRVQKIKKKIQRSPSWILIFSYLLLMSVITVLIGVFLDFCIHQLKLAHISFAQLSSSHVGSYFLWILFLVFFVLVAVIVTQLVSPAAAGSGIPQIKTILSGGHIAGFFSKKTLIAKVIGLGCFLGSGVVAGKEGAFIHLACIISHQLAKLGPFKRIFKGNNGMRDKVLAAATGLGVSANFGAPMAGLLFGIEVTTVYYSTRSYWFSAFVTVIGGVLFRFLYNLSRGNSSPMRPFVPVKLDTPEGDWPDIIAIVFLGVLLGVVSGIFTLSLKLLVKSKRKLAEKIPVNSNVFTYFWTIFAAVLTGIVTYPGFYPFLGLPSGDVLNQLLSSPQLTAKACIANTSCSEGNHVNWELNNSVSLGLALFIITRFPLQLTAFSIPAPGGLYYPIAALGAAIGRLFGESVNTISPGIVLPAQVYAIMGAGALPGGTTGAISTAIVIVELTGNANGLILIILCTLISVYVSSLLSDYVFVAILKLQGLPFLPDLENEKFFLTASHIKEPVFYLENKCSLQDFQAALLKYKGHISKNTPKFLIPIIAKQSSPMLIGAIYYHELEVFTRNMEAHIKDTTLQSQNFDILKNMSSLVEGVPIQFVPETPIVDIHRSFVLGHLDCAFVTKRGKLVGIITRDALKKVISKKFIQKNSLQ